jgi:hypothetical protein
MVYNTQDYWISGLCPSAGILKNTKFLSSGEGTSNRVGVSHPVT